MLNILLAFWVGVIWYKIEGTFSTTSSSNLASNLNLISPSLKYFLSQLPVYFSVSINEGNHPKVSASLIIPFNKVLIFVLNVLI